MTPSHMPDEIWAYRDEQFDHKWNHTNVVESVKYIRADNAPGEEEVMQAVETVESFIREVQHAQNNGPWWFTKGETGLYLQVRLWRDKAVKAIKTIRASLKTAAEKKA